MSPVCRSIQVVSIALLLAGVASAQEGEARKIAGGGITVPGWQGAVDPGSTQTVQDAKLAPAAGGLAVTTGPAIAYWNPKDMAKGDYTVSATFTEPKFMDLNTHPHPYGILIAGNGMGTAEQSYLYCAAYGSGTFILRGFGPEAFKVGAGRPEANEAIHKAAGPGQPVTQEIAVQVKGDNVSCMINGTVVKTVPKSELVTAGKLKSTDGVYGVRFAHNTDATVTGLKVTKP